MTSPPEQCCVLPRWERDVHLVERVPFAFGLAGVQGLRAPLTFSPVLGLQVAYKATFLLGVVVPLALAGELPPFAIQLAGLFCISIAGDLVVIPFPYLLSRRPAGK